MSSARKFAPAWPLALAGLLALSGCGFHPLYGDDAADVPAALATVAVAPIPDRQGQQLREAIEAQLDTEGAPVAERYVLNVTYTIVSEAAGINPDTSVSYNRFVAAAAWRLAPAGDPSHPIASGTATDTDSVNIIDSQYFALTLETGTVDRQLADALSRQVVDQLAVYFRKHPDRA